MARIRLERVRKFFGDVPVIREFDLTINDGEFFTFLGPSGCGKSTVLNMIAGLEPVTGGSIYFDDVPVNKLSPGERDVAMVFQSYALYPHMDVYENIAFPLKMKKTPKDVIGREVERVATILGLENLLRRRPGELSGGQRQRVALGRAIVRRPKVFLMDEPLSNLDARLRIEMRAELKRLHRELKITTVYVTHDQAEAMSLSERIAVLYQGEVQQCGTPPDVYARPANIFVGGFMGSPPMNFIPAVVRQRHPLEIDCNGIVFTPVLESRPAGSRLIVGARPEDVLVSAEKSEGAEEVAISLIEPVGPYSIVDFEWAGQNMKGISKEGAGIAPGAKAYMTLSAGKMVFFDKESGLRL
jgi:multiple sugar transport system ATP-binding protein